MQSVTPDGLPLLDSFLKESARFTSVDAVTCRRKALTSFKFSDGLSIAQGDWVCIPQQAMMHDPLHFRDPLKFDGFRFVQERGGEDIVAHSSKASLFTDTSLDWLVWGLGKTVWYDH